MCQDTVRGLMLPYAEAAAPLPFAVSGRAATGYGVCCGLRCGDRTAFLLQASWRCWIWLTTSGLGRCRASASGGGSRASALGAGRGGVRPSRPERGADCLDSRAVSECGCGDARGRGRELVRKTRPEAERLLALNRVYSSQSPLVMVGSARLDTILTAREQTRQR